MGRDEGRYIYEFHFQSQKAQVLFMLTLEYMPTGILATGGGSKRHHGYIG